MVHGLESSENAGHLLREMWRVLSDGGRLIVVVPNRRSIWARADHTPFGHGHPYSMEQLNRVLRQSMFTPVRETRALFFAPSRRRFWVTAAPAWERIGERWFSPLGGVAIVEATKADLWRCGRRQDGATAGLYARAGAIPQSARSPVAD